MNYEHTNDKDPIIRIPVNGHINTNGHDTAKGETQTPAETEKSGANVPAENFSDEEKYVPLQEMASPGGEEEKSLQIPADEESGDKDRRIAELEETVKRLHADFDNFRRRKDEEIARIKECAAERIMVELLPVLDNFERALDSCQISENYAALKEGLHMVSRQFRTALEKEGLCPINAVGQPLDPALHQVVQCRESKDHEDDTVVEEMLRGYKLGDKVIRPSMVTVSKKA